MAKLVPFPTRRVRDTAAYALALSARLERLSKAKPWSRHHDRPEQLGNLLQHLARQRPAIVLAIGNIVAEILAQLEQ